MFYRIKQFYWALTARLTDNDKEFVKEFLNGEESKVFFLLPLYEQVHSIKVARYIINNCYEKEIYDIILVKAGLLHDIGKVDGGLNVINTSVYVILDKLFPSTLKKCQNIKSIDTFYNHSEKALKFMDRFIIDEKLKYLIINHHSYNINNSQLKMLQEADSKN